MPLIGSMYKVSEDRMMPYLTDAVVLSLLLFFAVIFTNP
jgi:hypothetical protein